jgi:hypothetical protein
MPGVGVKVTNGLLDNRHNPLMIEGRMCSASFMASSRTVDNGAALSFSPNDKGQLSISEKGTDLHFAVNLRWGRFQGERQISRREDDGEDNIQEWDQWQMVTVTVAICEQQQLFPFASCTLLTWNYLAMVQRTWAMQVTSALRQADTNIEGDGGSID